MTKNQELNLNNFKLQIFTTNEIKNYGINVSEFKKTLEKDEIYFVGKWTMPTNKRIKLKEQYLEYFNYNNFYIFVSSNDNSYIEDEKYNFIKTILKNNISYAFISNTNDNEKEFYTSNYIGKYKLKNDESFIFYYLKKDLYDHFSELFRKYYFIGKNIEFENVKFLNLTNHINAYKKIQKIFTSVEIPQLITESNVKYKKIFPCYSEIMLEIILLTNKNLVTNKILYQKLNIHNTQLTKPLKFLQDLQLIELKESGKPKIFALTPKGIDFYNSFVQKYLS